MKAAAFFLPLLLSSSLVLADQDSSIRAKKVEMTAEEEATAIIQTGDGKIIGKTGDFIKELRPSKSGGNRNSSISAGENLTIKATGKGVVIVQTGNGTIVYQANKEAVKKLGVAEKSLASFFAILQVEDVPLQDWDKKLEEIAENYQRLKTQIADIQTDDQAIANLKKQAETAIDKGQLNEAKTLLDKAETLAMDSHVENRLITAADISASKGALAYFQLQYQLAGENYEDAANKIGALGDKHYVTWSHYLDSAGRAFHDAGQYQQALPLYDKALILREKHLPVNHPDVATSLNNFAELYRKMGQYEEAIPLHERALNIRENAVDKDPSAVATSLNNLAFLYYTKGQYEKALPLFKRSLELLEKNLGNDHPDVARNLNNIALLYLSTE
ncbi:tetratricopeptide repeat protein [Thiothrix litoralis]|jgi:tetratricopeptide (TPR) repeat protein|uniref:Tetratricopeptide repeat protein n=1 Tax=Thiothrix litoralis TaxID=2891210 RepID=A0ABX7WPI3_9GAMM|nr:tetratricopeptide repeat protein [Thiothrix litoralis]QTR45081.1 tetratricopeptide repeat protein [Thiothrix litoralis]